MVVTYSFETSPAAYLSSVYSQAFIDSFVPFNVQQQSQAEQAMAEWAAASGIVFVEVPAGQGDIRFGNYDFSLSAGTSGFNGFAYYPIRNLTENSAYESPLGGDVFLNSTGIGSHSYNLMLHEIGHAIGLQHPFEGEFQLLPQYDNGNYTVMSYNRDSSNSGMGIFDYDATQYLYGPAAFSPSNTGGVQSFLVNQATQTVTQTWGNAASDIYGSSLRDLVDAGAGNDKIAGFNGNDTLRGGAGDDTLFGGIGNDTLQGGAGNDTLYGGSYWGDPDAGSDTASFEGVRANVTATLGTGTWNGSTFVNASSTETGEDRFYDIDHLIGGLGSDSLTGNAGANMIRGSAGFDTIMGGLGDDTLLGEANADLLQGGDGDDSLVGGDGFDNLYGDAGNDTLDAGDTADRAYGGAGDDLIYGGANFGLTVDGLFGEAGNDTLWGQAGFDLLDGGDGDDLLDGGANADNLLGGAGNDTLRGGDGLDRLFGGDGNDLGRGGTGDDGLFGEAGDDTLFGEDGNDRFFGGMGDDQLDGGAGSDTLYGGAGFDTLTGGAGNDLLQGNFNADTFVFADGHGNDTIVDFDAQSSLEKIDLSGVGAIVNTFDLLSNHATQVGANVVIDTGGGNAITLQNVTLAQLDAGDFIF